MGLLKGLLAKAGFAERRKLAPDRRKKSRRSKLAASKQMPPSHYSRWKTDRRKRKRRAS
ncbi:MAG TPA: hypothetical protein VIJ93_04965 [bacterium]